MGFIKGGYGLADLFHFQVDLVINFNSVLDCKTYLQRIGGTGRFGKTGLAVNFVDSRQSHEILMFVKEYCGCAIANLNGWDPDAIERLQD